MDKQEIKETSIWQLYEIGENFHRETGIYDDTDKNYRMYNGNQWAGAIFGDVEPIQKNFIKPTVKYKLSVIHANLYSIHFSSMNFEDPSFCEFAEKCCKMLNRYAQRAWESDKMDKKGRKITKDAAINDEGILYVDFDKKRMLPINEVIPKNDIYYGDENNPEIQEQPYILIRKRMPVSNAREWAFSKGVSTKDLDLILGDKENFESSGEAAKKEVDDKVTIIYKLYKKDGNVFFSAATRYCEIMKDKEIGVTLYPVAHMNWEEKEGSARGEGEVRSLIPNQIEVNRTEMRRVLTVKTQAYPHKIVDANRVENPEALDHVGATIKTNDKTVDDVRKVVGTLPPAQMSSDVRQLKEDLIRDTRELAGAGDIATGQVNPELASGKAVIAVQQSSQAPITEQKEGYKYFLEDVAKIWLEYLINYSEDGINLEEKVKDPKTGKEIVKLVKVSQEILKKLQAVVKIDVTPKGAFDKIAQEMSVENLLVSGYFSQQKLGETEAYAEALDDDSVSPKMKILEICRRRREDLQKIARIDAESKIARQKANQYIQSDPNYQVEQIARALQAKNSQKSVMENHN